MAERRRRTRVLVCSSAGVRNLGDDAILLRTAERIRAHDRRARIDVLTDEAGPIPGFPALQPIGTNQNSDHVALDRYQLVIVAGGGFACDYFASHVTTRHRIAVRAEAAGVPVIVTGQGIGPLTEPQGMSAVSDLARVADAFSVRDELSLGEGERDDGLCVLTGDDALGLDAGRVRRRRHAVVLVHLREAWYHSTDADARATWAHALTKLTATEGTRLTGLVVNDRPEAPERATLRASGIERLIDATRDPRLAVSATRQAASVVSHSYHVALFALANGTPAVLAALNPYYAQKAEGLRRLAQLSDAFIVSEPPDAQELADRLDAIRDELRDNLALSCAAADVEAFFSREWARLVRDRQPPPAARDTP